MYFHWRNRNSKRSFNKHLQHTLQLLDRQNLVPVYEKMFIGTEAGALLKEIELISTHGRCDLGTGPLVNHTGGGQAGASTWSTQTRHNRSVAEKSKQKGRAVSQYDIRGEFIATFPSAKVASEHVPKANRSYITQCCKEKRVSAGGFLWAYEGNTPPPYKKKYYRSVAQFARTGELIAEYQSLSHAQAATNVELHNISECCRGKSQTAGGYVWKYTNPR